MWTNNFIYFFIGCENNTYDVKDFSKQMSLLLESLQDRPDVANVCAIERSPILIENYIGIASLLHNATELGFFKLRGKVSF